MSSSRRSNRFGDRSSNTHRDWLVGVLLAVALTVPTFVTAAPAIGPSSTSLAVVDSTEADDTQDERFSIADRNRWVADWLTSMDEDDDLVDDRAEDRARERIDAGETDATVGLLVSFDHWPTEADAENLEALGADVVYRFHRIPTIDVEVPATQVERVGALDGVAAVEWDVPMEPTLDTGVPAIQAREFQGTGNDTIYNGETAQALGYTGQGQVIAVLDTGVRDSHDAFEGKFVAGAITSSGTTECINPEDEDGHGTHVAGIAMANEPDAEFKGAAVDADLVDVKISAGPGSLGGVDRGFEWVADYNDAIENGDPKCGVSAEDKVNVATLSFGSTAPGGENAGSTETLIRDLNRQGVAVTIAAGNCGPEPSASCTQGGFQENGVSSPGNAAGAITVANVDENRTVDRADDVINPSSSRGPNENVSPENLTDRFRKPEIGAPGTDIKSASNLEEPFVQYYNLSGTSMSTPMIAGSAALLLQAGAEVADETDGVNALAPTGTGFFGDGSARVEQNPIREAFAEGADYTTAGVSPQMIEKWESQGVQGETWNNAFGYGEANLFGSICWAWDTILQPAGAQPPAVVDSKCDLEPKPLEVTTNIGFTTVNESVDLVASATGGEPRLDYSWSVVEAPDGANTTIESPNVEQTDFSADTAGAYAVEVAVTDANGTTVTANAPVTVYEQPPTSSQTFRSYDFENGTDCDREGWSSFQLVGFSGGPSGSTTAWHLESESAKSDPCAWYHGTATGEYENNQNTYIISPGGEDCFDLPSGLSSATFAFPTAGTLEQDFDFMHVERSPCDADSWSTLRSYTGQHGSWTAEPAVYEDLSVDVSDRIGGEAFQLRLRVRTDSIVTDVGYRVDSFELTGQTPVNNSDPVATFTSSCDQFTCSFDATDSEDPDGELLSHVWEFSDGTTKLGATVEHTFDTAGNHSATLTVTDDEGARNTVTKDVIVRGPLDVQELDPQTVEAGTTTTVDILGSGFQKGVEIDLDDGAGPEPGVEIVFVDPLGTFVRTEITVDDGGPKDTTKWDVIATNPDGETDELEDGLHVFRPENDA